MGVRSVVVLVAFAAGCSLVSKTDGGTEPSAPSPGSARNPSATPPPAPEPEASWDPNPPVAAPPPPPAPSAPPKVWGRADLDPTNDRKVAPPEEVPSCERRLTEAGVTFQPSKLPLKTNARGGFSCGSHKAVRYVQGPTSIKITPRPIVDCNLALALAAMEQVFQEEAERHLGKKIRSIKQLGTYNCRKMARYDWVSEHSYGNAIDIERVTFEDWSQISVLGGFGKLDAAPATDAARFLRSVAHRLVDEQIFSVVLTPYWDKLHRNHFHLDLARYRVDGSRPR